MINKDFNFIPYEILRAQKNRQKANMAVLLTILAVVSAFSFLLIPYNEIQSLEARKESYERSIQAILGIENYEKLLALEMEKLSVRQNVMNMISKEEKDFLLVLEAIEDAVSTDVFLTSVSLSVSGVKLTGTAASELALADFIRDVKLTGLFEDVYLPSYNMDGGSGKQTVTFTVDCLLVTG